MEIQRIFVYCGILLIFSASLIAALRLIYNDHSLIKLQKHKFLFTQLVKRDFTLKYKRTILGMLWSVLSPLFNLLIMWLIFKRLLGNSVDHFVVYLFSGQLVFSYFSDATNQGMTSLIDNASIFTKVNVPKYMFLFSKNISSLINFGLTLIIFFIFVFLEGIPITEYYIMLAYPIVCLILFNVGMGLVLSGMYVFFRDMQYLWGIATQLIMWLSAIFYSIDSYPQVGQNLFLLNPIYLFIRYIRKIVIEGQVPSVGFHLIMGGYTVLVLLLGFRMYKKNNHSFLYYV
ncbi:ABC transporter permease [Fusibacter paucivorans]|uniref:Transport permease protein n=2 Tax=Fusibacter paucivorans TaxID=76009 RepID=A0ABS5PN57_9FIRM|nr:ABC transporter permease [Fusibacter paucivorans]